MTDSDKESYLQWATSKRKSSRSIVEKYLNKLDNEMKLLKDQIHNKNEVIAKVEDLSVVMNLIVKAKSILNQLSIKLDLIEECNDTIHKDPDLPDDVMTEDEELFTEKSVRKDEWTQIVKN